MIDFNELDNIVDVSGMVETDTSTPTEYEDMPDGEYFCTIEKMEIGQSKAGKPKAVIWFKVFEGEYKNRLLFYNQVLTEDFHFSKVNKVLRTLDSGYTGEIKIKRFKEYNDMLIDIHELVADKIGVYVSYTMNKNGFPTFDVTGTAEL